MSTKKLTLQTEKFQRASNEIMVLSSNPINGKIYPSFVLPTESIYLKNTKYLVLKSAADTADAYITRDASDNLLIANLKISGELQLTHTMASGNQRYLLLKEYGATDTQAIQAPYTLTIVTENDDIQLLPAGDVVIGASLVTNGDRIKSTETSTTTATISDDVEVHFCNSASAYTVTMPAQVAGKEIKIIGKGAGQVTIVPASGAIMGETSQIINQYDTIILVSDGTNWF